MQIVVVFLPFLLGIILHEIAHGLMALKCGDPTARMLGRLTLNPLPHIDPAGLGCFVFTSLFTPFVFGWAKPVPVNTRYFRNYRRDMLLVSAAGPLCNFFLALLMGLCLRLFLLLAPDTFILHSSAGNFLLQMLLGGISANLVLAWFNLLPIPPLDGFHVIEELLPYKIRYTDGYKKFSMIAPRVLLGIIMLGSITGVNVLSNLIDLIKAPFMVLIELLMTPIYLLLGGV